MRQLRRSVAVGIAVAALAGAAGDLQAQPASFFANLTTDQEPPTPAIVLTNPTRAPFGTATFQLNAARTQLSFSAVVSGIDFSGTQTPGTNDNLRAAHIHALATPLNATGPVVWGFFGAPFHDVVNPVPGGNCVPSSTGVGGTCTGTWDFGQEGAPTITTDQMPALFEGRMYMNFHTEQNPSGEIRGRIINTVPEPASVLLLGAGLLGIGGLAWRRRSTASTA